MIWALPEPFLGREERDSGGHSKDLCLPGGVPLCVKGREGTRLSLIQSRALCLLDPPEREDLRSVLDTQHMHNGGGGGGGVRLL